MNITCRIDNMRFSEIDIVKCLCILLVVYGHCYLPGTHFIYLFHISSFIICAGFTFKSDYSVNIYNVLQFIKKRLLKLYIPYIIFNFLYCIFNNVFVKIKFLPDELSYGNGVSFFKNVVSIFLFHGYTYFGGPTWFLRALFLVSIISVIIDFLIKKVIHNYSLLIEFLLSFFLILICYYLNLSKFCLDLGYICYFYNLFILGRLIRLLYEKINSGQIYKLIVMCSSFVILIILNGFGSIELLECRIQNPSFYIIVSYLGFIMLLFVSDILKGFTIIMKVLSFIGQKTIWILGLHFFIFKLVTFLIVKIYRLPKNILQNGPTILDAISNKIVWGGVYICSAIIFSITISYLYTVYRGKINA